MGPWGNVEITPDILFSEHETLTIQIQTGYVSRPTNKDLLEEMGSICFDISKKKLEDKTENENFELIPDFMSIINIDPSSIDLKNFVYEEEPKFFYDINLRFLIKKK